MTFLSAFQRASFHHTGSRQQVVWPTRICERISPPKHWHPCSCQKHHVNLSCAAKGDLRKIDALGNIMLHYATLAWTEITVSTLRSYVSYFCPTAPVICVTLALNALHDVLSEKWTVLTEGQLVGMSGEHVLLCHLLLKSSFKRPYFALSFSLKSIYNVS